MYKNRQLYLKNYSQQNLQQQKAISRDRHFVELCQDVSKYVNQINNEEALKLNNHNEITLREEQASIGVESAKQYYKTLIKDFITSNNKTTIDYPDCYKTLIDAVYEEIWGFGKISEWIFDDKYKFSSDCEVTEGKIHYKINGKNILQKHSMTESEVKKLVKKLLLINKEKQNHKSNFHEVYTNNGIRCTIVENGTADMNTKISFRKYVVNNINLYEQYKLNTIPYKLIPLVKHIIDMDGNIAVTGAVGSGKTTFLNTILALKNQSKKGVVIQNDPEIDFKSILPNAPIQDIITNYLDEKEKEDISKIVLRSNADYIVFGEAREREMLDIFMELSSRGTRGNILTYHTDLPAQLINNILHVFNDSNQELIKYKLTQAIDFIFHMRKLDDGKKILDSVTFISNEDGNLRYHKLMEYNIDIQDWEYNMYIDKEKEVLFKKYNNDAYKNYTSVLEELNNDD